MNNLSGSADLTPVKLNESVDLIPVMTEVSQ